MNLKNAVALITGGSSGIGRAVAEALATSGARVAITGRDESRLKKVAQQLGAQAIHADVSVEADVMRTYREVAEKLGQLDILVNNAGVGVFKGLVDFGRAEFEAVFATNVTGAMLMAREAAKIFVARDRGNIVNIASTAGLRGATNGTAYYYKVASVNATGTSAQSNEASATPVAGAPSAPTALTATAEHYLQLAGFTASQVLENKLRTEK